MALAAACPALLAPLAQCVLWLAAGRLAQHPDLQAALEAALTSPLSPASLSPRSREVHAPDVVVALQELSHGQTGVRAFVRHALDVGTGEPASCQARAPALSV